MNYGYTPFSNESPLHLNSSDEDNRYPIQLYHYLVTKVDLTGLDLLEVGSGRGGGTAYLKRYFRPRKIVGIDIAGNAVKLAREHYSEEGIEFIRGSAEQLPLNDESFDVVLNVESSHAYGSVPKFLSEVKRVLRPGGYFLCTDIRPAASMQILKQQLRACGMQLLTEEDISENVSRAIEVEEPIKQKRIQNHIPFWLQKTFKQFAGVVNSKAHIDLISRQLVYCRFVLKKEPLSCKS